MKLFRGGSSALVALLFAVVPVLAWAQNSVSSQVVNYGYDFYDANNIKQELDTLTTDLMGDQIDPASGSISFTQTDISIPGNSHLKVELSRVLPDADSWKKHNRWFANWSLNLPHIKSTYLSDPTIGSKDAYWPLGKACSSKLNSNPRFTYISGVGSINPVTYETIPSQYWHGDTLEIPGMGSVKFTEDHTKNPANRYKRYNNKNWDVSCLTNPDGSEGFKVVVDNGDIYYFQQPKYVLVDREYEVGVQPGFRTCRTRCPPIEKGDSGPSKYILHQYLALMLVTKVEDRFGNWVKYNYSGGNLSSITANDGRSISLGYSGSRITSAVANGKSWTYKYDTNRVTTLKEVVRPDSKKWTFSHPKNDVLGFWYRDFKHTQVQFQGTSCLRVKGGEYIDITHPEGMSSKFTVWERCHGSSNVPKLLIPGLEELRHFNDNYYIPINHQLYSITEKELTFPSGTKYSWKYDYSENNGFFAGEAVENGHKINGNDFGFGKEHLKTLTVHHPDNKKVVSYFDRRYGETSGDLLVKETYSPLGKLLERNNYTYKMGTHHGSSQIKQYMPVTDRVVPIYPGEYSASQQKLTTKEVVTHFDATSGASLGSYTTEYQSFNAYDKPLQIKEYNSFNGKQLWTKQDYYHDTRYNLLNLPYQTSYSSNGSSWTPTHKTTYWGSTSSYKSLPYQTHLLGRAVSQVSSYHADGNKKRVDYHGSNRYELFENYYRGKPRKITLPCHQTNACNTANGSTSNTVVALLAVNGDGTTQSITDFKGNTTIYGYNAMQWLTTINPVDAKWSNTHISYAHVNAGDGISGSNIPANSLKQTITQGNYRKRVYHDALLRPVFTVEEDVTRANSKRYQAFAYDAENRKTLDSFPSSAAANRVGMTTGYDALGRVLTQTNTADNSVVTTRYLSSNRVQVTDAKGHATTTTYLAYGKPMQEKPSYIDAPEGADVSIGYNLFDQITRITQGGVTETRVYNGYQQLCKKIRPETGHTVYGLNTQSQIDWLVEGASGSTTTCSYTGGSLVDYGYDNQGKLANILFPDASPDQTYRYDENGNLEVLTSGSSSWTYGYNSKDLVESQTLSIDGKSFTLNPDYDSLGNLSAIGYPSGRSISFATNALGQGINAGKYVSNATYHANGMLDTLTYANGVSYSTDLNSRQLPQDMYVRYGSKTLSDLSYSYDKNQNVSYIDDAVNSQYDISLTYDGLNRLKTASGYWGSGSFNYDALGNITSKTLGSHSLSYSYDSSNLLRSVTGSKNYVFAYDSRGNVTDNGHRPFSYNLANQMTTSNGISYLYDGHNRRVKKTQNGKSDYSLYSQDGTLLYRQKANGTHVDYIYLNKRLVTTVESR